MRGCLVFGGKGIWCLPKAPWGLVALLFGGLRCYDREWWRIPRVVKALKCSQLPYRKIVPISSDILTTVRILGSLFWSVHRSYNDSLILNKIIFDLSCIPWLKVEFWPCWVSSQVNCCYLRSFFNQVNFPDDLLVWPVALPTQSPNGVEWVIVVLGL